MEFRLRSLDSENDAKFQAADRRYRDHLESFPKSSNTDLWKFFYWDFFGDGWVTSMSISKDLKTVTLNLVSPNIKWLHSKDKYAYRNVSFSCTFQNVIHLDISSDEPYEWDIDTHKSCFLGSEINTSPLLKTIQSDEQDSDSFYSLLIQFEVKDTCIWLEAVFSQVDVKAEEPVAFALMEANDKFEVPVYKTKHP